MIVLVEFFPSVGVDLVKLGDSRKAVRRRLGQPVHRHNRGRAVYTRPEPGLVISYDDHDVVELIEIPYGHHGDQVVFEGVQLTYRLMDHVVADLVALGYEATPTDIGFAFEPGFAIFSMGSLSPRDIDPRLDQDDVRDIVEGVSIGPYAYFLYQS